MITISKQEVDKFISENPSVDRWLRNKSIPTKYAYSHDLARFFKWLKNSKRISLNASEVLDDHLDCRRSGKVVERKKWLNFALDFTRDNPELKEYSKARLHQIFGAITSWFAYNEVPLTTTKGEIGTIRRKYKPKPLDIGTAKKIILNSKQRERTVFMVMLQSGMGIGETLKHFNFQWTQIKTQLAQGKSRVRIDIPERKGKGASYYTFISQDAIQELKKYVMKRGEPKHSDEPIFISQTGRKITPREVYACLHTTLRKLGLPFGKHQIVTHQFRKLFKTITRKESIDPDIAEFFMGHLSGIEAVGGIYDKSPELYQDMLEKEYTKLESSLNILSPKISPTEEAIAKAQILDALKKVPKERRKEHLKLILEGLPYHIRKTVKNDKHVRAITEAQKISPLRLKKKHRLIVAKEKNEDCQKIISESELESWLVKGWHVEAVLTSGKIVVSND